ncbi:MAG: DUF6311 domain-containing protein [Bacteroidota bacterium]
MKTTLLHTAILFAAVLTLIQLKFGLQILNVFEINWWLVPCSDSVPGILSWDYFREQAWQYPLGQLQGYNHPLTTNIALTDGIPLMAVIFKLLHPLFGGEAYYYFGWWFLLSFVLQAYFGYRLLSLFLREERIYALLGTLSLLIAPVFLDRFPHHALAMQWVILASFYYYFQTQQSAGRRLLSQTYLVAAMAWVHPYAAFMTLMLSGGLLLKVTWVEKGVRRWQMLLIGIGWVAMTMGLWEVMGYFSVGNDNLKTNDFGIFSANWNTLFNSLDKAAILPSLPLHKKGQYEGFGYLGVGVLGLWGLVILTKILFKKWTPQWRIRKAYLPLLLVVILATLFSVSHIWTFNDAVFTQMDYPQFLTDKFRSSGRFIWLLHYSMLLFAIIAWSKSTFSNVLKISIFGLAFGVQVYDISPLLSRGYVQHHGANYSYHKPTWQPLLKNVDRIWTYPAHKEDYLKQCDYGKLLNLAQSHQIPISVGKMVYYNKQEIYNTNAYLEEQLKNGLVDEQQSAFITTFEHYDAFKTLIEQNDVQAFLVEKYLVLLPTALYQATESLQAWQPINDDLRQSIGLPLTDYLDNHPKATIFIAVKDDAKTALDETFINWMEVRGSSIRNLPFRGSYAGILRYHQVVTEKISADKTVTVEFDENTATSSGKNASNFSSIKIDGQECSPSRRGLNIVIMERDTIVDIVNFDTYRSSFLSKRYTFKNLK